MRRIRYRSARRRHAVVLCALPLARLRVFFLRTNTDRNRLLYALWSVKRHVHIVTYVCCYARLINAWRIDVASPFKALTALFSQRHRHQRRYWSGSRITNTTSELTRVIVLLHLDEWKSEDYPIQSSGKFKSLVMTDAILLLPKVHRIRTHLRQSI